METCIDKSYEKIINLNLGKVERMIRNSNEG